MPCYYEPYITGHQACTGLRLGLATGLRGQRTLMFYEQVHAFAVEFLSKYAVTSQWRRQLFVNGEAKRFVGGGALFLVLHLQREYFCRL